MQGLGKRVMGEGKQWEEKNQLETTTQLVPILGHPTSKGPAQGFALSADIRKRDGDFFSSFFFSEIFPYFLGAASCEETKLYYLYCFFLYVCCVLKRKKQKTNKKTVK